MANGDKLNVDYTELEEALPEMTSAASDFRDMNNSAFQTDREQMEPMNSDFIESFSRILECFPGWSAKNLLDHLDTFCSDAETIMNNLKATDEAHEQSRVEGTNG